MNSAPRTGAPVGISVSDHFDVFNERYVILDFKSVGTIDASTFTKLLRMRRRRRQHQLPVERLVGVNAQLRKIFRMTHLDRVWPMYETVDEAMESFAVSP